MRHGRMLSYGYLSHFKQKAAFPKEENTVLMVMIFENA